MTRAARIDALLERVAPQAMAAHRETGQWPFKPGQDKALEAHLAKRNELAAAGQLEVGDEAAQAAYVAAYSAARRDSLYRILADGEVTKLSVTTDDGDVIAAVGGNIDEAIAAMEKKVGAAQ